MRPEQSHAASQEPTATATEKTVRKTVITPSVVLMLMWPSGSSSDRTSAPTSQNQLTTMAPHHSRGSVRSSLMRSQVEARMLRLITRVGAPSPVGGISRLDNQLANAVSSISQAKWMGLLSPLAAMPATMVPSRIARKVPPSISALPPGSSAARQMIGQNAVFDRAEQRAERSEQKQRDEQQQDRMKGKAQDRERRGAHLDELDALRHPGLVVAVGDFAAEAGEKEVTER